jgi:alpha-L-rhamnosidase
MFTNVTRARALSGLVTAAVALFGSWHTAAATRDERSPLSTFFVAPTRIVWQSASGVENGSALLEARPGQALVKDPQPRCTLRAAPGAPAGILLDFGRELTGYVELITPGTQEQQRLRHLQVRFGESVSEAMAELGGPHNAQNDHALRDQVVTLPWMGKTMVGPSGFRFVRLDNTDAELAAELSQVRAVLQIRDIPQVGSFRCDDERLNRIWLVGAYTVHLNMQEYLWDGIKRDRLVWIGDMHPEVSTILAVFGANEVVPRSLDLARDVTPATEWIDGIAANSMRWILIQEELWLRHGDRAYLASQRPYLTALLGRLAAVVGPDGREHTDGWRFLDWPSSENPRGVDAGLQAMTVLALESGARLMTVLGEADGAQRCTAAAARARQVVLDANGSKFASALLVLAGMTDARLTAESVLEVGGARGLSPFAGFYVLQALGRAGRTQVALDIVRSYWGAMLDLGATTFWEHFDLDWTANASRIDELVPPGKKDIHGDFGAYCYVGLRHSLCHGWAGGPTAWLSEQVLGVRPLEPGCRRVRVAPELGDLRWAEGVYPTPAGPIRLRHERGPDGKVRSKIEAPAAVIVERP